MKKLLLITVIVLSFITTKAQTVQNSPDTNKIYASVPVEPQFVGGSNALNQFIIHNLKVVQQGVTGTVFVGVVVERDGRLTHFMVMRKPSEKLGDEALRVLKLSPNWDPGLIDGKPVRVSITIPVRFK